MFYRNHIELIGNAGQDPALAYTPKDGTPYTRISLATNERYKDRAGNAQESTEWHTVVFWGELAEFAARTLKKGSYMLVEGTLKSRTYEKEGVEHRKWEVRATRLGLLDRKEKADASAAVPEGEPQAPAAEDAIPF